MNPHSGGDMILAIDAGLSSIKILLYGADGRAWAMVESPNDAVHNQGPSSEVDMLRLWELVCMGIRSLCRDGAPLGSVAGVGLSGHGNGLYLVTPAGDPVKGMTSMDQRAAGIVGQWQAAGTAAEYLAATANHLWAGQPLPLLQYLVSAGCLPAEWRLLFCKDWIRHKLTGEMVTDRCEASAAGLLDSACGEWAGEFFEAAGFPGLCRRLPGLVYSQEATGVVSSGAAGETGLPEGIPVFGGSIDLALASMADGLDDPRILHITTGTWSVNQQLCAEAGPVEEFLQTVVSPTGTGFLRIDSSPTSGINLKILSSLLGGTGEDYAEWEWIVGQERLDFDDPVYLPYPAGAWDLSIRGAEVRGLRLGLDRSLLVRAVYDGIALGHLRQIRRFQRIGELAGIVLCGGMSRSDAWCRLLCDYAGLPLSVSENPHSSALGAALSVRQGLGILGPKPPYAPRRYTPRPERVCLHRYHRFCEYLEDLQEEDV